MDMEYIVRMRRQAEEAVADMPETPLRLKAFEVILSSLLAGPLKSTAAQALDQPQNSASNPTSLTERVMSLATDGFFGQPRSLAEIQAALAQRGWHYAQTHLSTPLIRLVQKRELRRLRSTQEGRRVWVYSLR